MGLIKLEPRCPKNVNGLSVDPNPDWTFDDLLSELDSLQHKLNSSPLNPKPFSREIRGFARREEDGKKGFVMRVSDDESDETDNEDETRARTMVPVGRFVCDDIYLSESDESEDDSAKQLQVPFMGKMGVVEGAFLELTHEYQIGIKEEIRNQISALETELTAEKEKSTSALVQVEKNTEARREMDRKLDMHYQRKIAEALDNHLTAIQRDHEHMSQIEERRIRDDAALEEAKRKEKALQEEKLRQLKAEEEARRAAAKRAEEERKAAEQAERAAKEAEDKKNIAKVANGAQMATMSQEKNSTSALQNVSATTSTTNVSKKVQSAGKLVRAAESALKLEESRLQKYKELEDKNQSIISSDDKNLRALERVIARQIKQITGSIESVRSKASELVKIFNGPSFPQSVTVAMFAKKVISIYETPNANFNSSAFACGHVIVYVSAQVPAVMDCLLAEFHKACIFTVPKHMAFSESVFQTREAYYKAIGYREEDGKMESTEQYLERLGSYMKLYGALIQTEVQGFQNIHGLEQGWMWLARFLNALPATLYTAVALEAFLRMAGFGLHRKYKSQFVKILNAITREFLAKLKQRGNPEVNSIITRLQDYIESKKFLEEPEGWRLKNFLLSSGCTC